MASSVSIMQMREYREGLSETLSSWSAARVEMLCRR